MKIEFRNISKSFNRGSTEKIKALDAVNLLIPPSQFLVVIGPNGSGKSTLLNILSGSAVPDAGSLWIDGKDMTGQKEFVMNKMVARVFQNPLSGTAPGLSILENFRLASLRTKSKLFKIGINNQFMEFVREKLSVLNLGLENKLDQPMGTLSGGQRQALTILMATMDKAGILLLDEPSAALDPRTSADIMNTADKIIKEYKLTAILVTHSLKDAMQYGDRLICMGEGRIVRDIRSSEEKMKLQVADLFSWFNT